MAQELGGVKSRRPLAAEAAAELVVAATEWAPALPGSVESVGSAPPAPAPAPA